MTEYLVKVTTSSRCWVEAENVDVAKEIARDMFDSDDVDVKKVDIVDSRIPEHDDDYLAYLDDLEEEEEYD